ncbi:hypothetical protein D1867_11770 [Acidianus infernus]|uniref:Uncharacterized protein n=2 Tax=Acidianus infernus TaxID=12915 RepID=A0A6A9QGL1_ACIIN|nr:hypothetical protein [Acidianus infernus]MCY0883046.1 hypothetical protein [Acidianus infernus]MUM65899.1 hypothetical protein [Acidianus infernus]
MLEREVKGTIEEDEMKILSDVYDINNLREWWMFLRKIEKIDEENYRAEFRVFMTFKFHMKRTLGSHEVIHEGTMRFPRAYFRFIVETIPYKKDKKVDVIIRGQYKGPLERLARLPMDIFLKNFFQKLAERYKTKTEEEKQNILSLINEQLEASREYNGRILLHIDECTIVFEGGKIGEVSCNGLKGEDALKELTKKENAKIKVEYK